MSQLDIIIPVKDEEKNLGELVQRIHRAMSAAGIPYSMIFVDDDSRDNTVDQIIKLSEKYPIKWIFKEGKAGKAYSILEGSQIAQAEYLAMIDGDLQYPPEALPEMFKLAKKHGVAVANRKTNDTNRLRKIGSKVNAFVFDRLLLGFNCDTQSGLKVFKKEVIEHLKDSDVTPWTLDMPLLYTAQESGYTIGSVDIHFRKRKNGLSKIRFVPAAVEIVLGAVKLRLRRRRIYHLSPESEDSMIGAGIAHKRRRFVTHTELPHHHSAFKTFHPWQKLFLAFLGTVFVAGLLINAKLTAIIVIGLLSTIYFLDALFSFFVLAKSLHFPPEIKVAKAEIDKIEDGNLPVYSILCPLYREGKVLPHFLAAIDRIDWPKEKLDVQLLLEEDDEETRQVAESLDLPSYVRPVIVPHSQPKTKPKACNYGLARAKGEFVVVYDAEDRPDPLQLKKAYLAFQKVDPKVFCLQSKLNYYNPHHNLLTRLFTAEYSLWFDVILPGLQSIEAAIPLGGTSNHFRTKDLRGLHAWDAFNVTEDCDLGVRLFKAGYKTEMIDSTTLEEANSHVVNWLRQRSRWIKGYMQTYMVHTRDPVNFVRNHGLHALIFQLVVGMRMTFLLINPILWAATISYFAAYSLVGPAIEALYPAPVFYMAVASLVFGNFMYLYNYMIGSAKREHWSVIKFVFLVPFYWLLTSIAASIAVYQLVFRPHFWEKTHHGLHLKKEDEKRAKALAQLRAKEARRERLGRLGAFAGNGVVGGGALILASLVANTSNFLYNAYLGRSVSLEEFGLVSLISSFFALTGIATVALGRTVTHRGAYLYGKYGRAVKEFWALTRRRIVAISLGLVLLWLVLIPLMTDFFKAETVLPFILFTPIWIVGLARAVDGGYLAGNLKFALIAALALIAAFSKLSITYVLVSFGFSQWVYAAIPASVVIAFFIGWVAARRLKAEPVSEPSKTLIEFPNAFFAASLVAVASSVAFLSFDVVLAKFYLSPTEAGEYALLSLSGKIVFFLGMLFAQFMNPLVSRAEGAGKDSAGVFYKLLLATALVSMAGFVVVGAMGAVTIPILFGTKTAPILSLLPMYTFGIFGYTIATTIVIYHQVKKHYLFPLIGFGLVLAQLVGISLSHDSVGSLATIIGGLGIAYLTLIGFLHLSYDKLVTIARNTVDFLYLFARPPRKLPVSGEGLRILIFNWRDTKHVWAGGAEVYVHELAKRWVGQGHRVTLFCGSDRRSPRNEVVEGVQVVRRGGFYTVYIWAFLYYALRFRGRYDVILDCENGIPFFTPLYARTTKFLVIHHVHQDIFLENLKAPFSWIAVFLESKLMPLVYRNCDVITVSESSKKAIMRQGLTQRTPIVVYNGIDLEKYVPGKKAKQPLLVYVGRLKPYKNLPLLIEAVREVVARIPQVRLVIAGFGEEQERLQRRVEQLGLEKYVKLAGRVSEKKKIRLYQEAWVAVNPSSMEGWSITSIEANACGTPVVASNVPGLRDSVRNPLSGFLVEHDNPQAFADSIFRLITNRRLREDLSKSSRQWAKQFRWEASAERFLELFKKNKG